ncbi:MAG TPA: alpha/beta family hydrolase [Myxococcota bacterium]|jgi:hypothetical protein
MATKKLRRISIRVAPKVTTTALIEGEGERVFVCAHGAGGSMNDRSMSALADALVATKAMRVVRFNFLYSERGSGRPDKMPQLIACFSAVVARVQKELALQKLVLGGRSMGGRASSMMAAEGFACDGLLLFAYPLHPAGAPEKLRDAHLPNIAVPVACFSGTRDDLCTRGLMERALATMQAPVQMHWIDDADHSFHVRKTSGTDDKAVLARVASEAAAFVATL